MAIVPSWSTTRVYATWRMPTGEMPAGTYRAVIPTRVLNTPDDTIIPAGVFATGNLQTVEGSPSLDIQLPCTNDPDNLPTGFQIQLTISFTGTKVTETYFLNTLIGQELNLRTVLLPEALPTPQPVILLGVPGGVAIINSDGNVLDGNGDPIGTVTPEALETAIGDYLATHPVAGVTDYNDLENVPLSFPPSAHEHPVSQLSDLGEAGQAGFLTAATNALARAAIGAGTSSLVIGTTAGTAAEGSAVVPKTGAVTKDGVLTLTSAPVIPDNSLPISKIIGLQDDLDDAMYLSGDQTVDGVITFLDGPLVPDNSFDIAKIIGLATQLAALAQDSLVIHKAGVETFTGVKTFNVAPVLPNDAVKPWWISYSDREIVVFYDTATSTWPAKSGLPALPNATWCYHWKSMRSVAAVEPPEMDDNDIWTPHPESAIYATLSTT